MKDFGADARAAIGAGTAIGVGAVAIALDPDPLLIWGGYGELTIGDDVYQGVGDRGLVSVVGSAIGDAEQNTTLSLSGVDPQALALFDISTLRRAPVICQRLIFDAAGQVMLAAETFTRGRLDQAPKQETPGGEATISAQVETAARGLGRGGGRTRSSADQALVDAGDDGFKSVSYAGQQQIYWGGKIPQTAQAAFGATPGGLAGGIDFSDIGPQGIF